MSDYLISRSALIDALIKCDGLGRKSCELVAKVIKEQPVAYNLDKVVEQLKDAECRVHMLSKTFKGIDTDKAIEIVRQGGV